MLERPAMRTRLLLGGLIALIVMGATYFFAYSLYARVELDQARERAGIYKASLVSALEQYDHLPSLLAEDPFIIASAVTQEAGRLSLVNRRLQQFAALTDVDAIYLMREDGVTIAASNWNREVNYLGQNYSFRPYFQQAISGERASYFAIGATTRRPGYFISAPVRNAIGEPKAVIALKVEFDRLIDAWRAAEEKIFVANADGVVVLATNPDWTFKATGPIGGETRLAFNQAKKFLNHPLPDLGMTSAAYESVHLAGKTYLRQVVQVGLLGWELHYLTSSQSVVFKSWQAVLFVAVSLISLLAFFLLLYSRRIRRALRESQEARRELRLLNNDLEREIDERRAAEARLESAQQDLRKASKLAALGQLSASVSHELGQPISAMQNYLASAQLPGADIGDDAKDIFQRLGRITERMSHVTRQLKFFAKPAESNFDVFDLRDVVRNGLEMMTADLGRHHVKLNLALPETGVHIRGDKLRIEQVLVNLIRNGLDAMSMEEDQQLDIDLKFDDNIAHLIVTDCGEGLPEGMEDHVFDPFFTTKASGEGLGLGLAISASILNDHQGTLEAHNQPDGGAAFHIRLPLAA